MSRLSIWLEPTTVRTMVVHLTGELDASSVGEVESCVGAIEPGCTTVILDLRLVTVFDAAAIEALDRLHRDLDAAARCLQLRNAIGVSTHELAGRSLGRSFVLV